jgi:hypothetical protein
VICVGWAFETEFSTDSAKNLNPQLSTWLIFAGAAKSLKQFSWPLRTNVGILSDLQIQILSSSVLDAISQ